MYAVDELRTITKKNMKGSILRTKLQEKGYYDDHLDDPLTTRLIYDVMKIVEEHAANSSNVIHDVSECSCKGGSDHAIDRICQKCNGIIPIRHYSH